MPVVNTKPKTKGNLVKREFWAEDGWNYKNITALQGSTASYVVGTVLGKITASGKYKIAVETAVDGSKVPAAIVVQDTDVLATDSTVLTMVRGPAVVAKEALVFDSSYDNETKLNTAYAALEALSISPETQV